MDPLAAIKATFFQECEEQLAELESGLLSLEAGEGDRETVNAVFRAVHSIKGGAGAFALDDLVRFAHVFETTLDELRSGKLQADHDVLAVLLRAADVLADLVRAALSGESVEEARPAAIAAELKGLSGKPVVEEAAEEEIDPFDLLLAQAAAASAKPAEAEAAAPPRWIVAFRPHRSLYAKANEAALTLRELSRLGPCETVLDASAVPPLDSMDPEEAYLAWTVTVATEAGEEAIREVFEFVDGDCTLEIRPADAESPPAPASDDAGGSLPANFDIASLLAQVGTIAPDTEEKPSLPAEAPSNVVELAKARPEAAAPSGTPAAPPQATIRVDLERVDRLINLVGELVINQAMLAQRVAESGISRSSNVAIGLDELEQLTREIQDSVMAIRAQPVKSVFQRMPRLVREVAAMTKKQVRLVTEGEGTEVDKTVIEKLTDPITHMIRNAIDHGLEPSAEARIAAGKNPEGVVRLSALHRGGRIVIEVADDGRGINRERVRSIAVEKSLIAPDANLSDEEVDNLIFMPGFSTADEISDISGRGVGMDVVRRSIQALGGRISIASRPGLGSTFTLSLPLTLAVLDGMVVTVAGQTLVAPLNAIVETLQPKAANVRNLGAATTLIAVRDTYTPLIDIGQMLGYRSEIADPSQSVALLVETEGGARAAIMVDAIQGQRQVVIKSLEANYRQVQGIAAATILGDGRVALILDVDAIVATRGWDAAGEREERLAAAG